MVTSIKIGELGQERPRIFGQRMEENRVYERGQSLEVMVSLQQRMIE
jgi:hypothetical protein